MTDYNSLVKNGLKLSESEFNLIHDSLVCGVREAQKYLNVPSDSWPKFIFDGNINVLGYSIQKDAVALPLSQINTSPTPLEYKDQLLCFMPNVFYIIVKYVYWLKLFGREATIHRYQKIGTPLLKKQFPNKSPASIPRKTLLLSDIEVEARTIIDAISEQIGETPVWKNFDAFLSKNYPEHYSKSIEELEKLPQITLPLCFEMEYYVI